MQPYYRLDGSTRYIILQLRNKCIDLNLDNISFCYIQDKINFYLKEQENCWELVVKGELSQAADVWIIDDDSFLYKYSETYSQSF
ncbi:MAG: hypothetical protein AAGU27_24245 [Dehalobacterium sp.]